MYSTSELVDYFVVRLPHHGTRLFGACVVCGDPCMDVTAGSVFMCQSHWRTHCRFCGYTFERHVGPSTTPVVALTPAQVVPGRQCPDFKHVICADCWLQMHDARALLTQEGIVHYTDCLPEDRVFSVPIPVLRRDSDLYQALMFLEAQHDSFEQVQRVIKAAPRPWRAEADWVLFNG